MATTLLPSLARPSHALRPPASKRRWSIEPNVASLASTLIVRLSVLQEQRTLQRIDYLVLRLAGQPPERPCDIGLKMLCPGSMLQRMRLKLGMAVTSLPC